jgi:hypothetical protein
MGTRPFPLSDGDLSIRSIVTPTQEKLLDEAATLDMLLRSEARRKPFGSNLCKVEDYAEMLARCDPEGLQQAFAQLQKDGLKYLGTSAGAKWLIANFGSGK